MTLAKPGDLSEYKLKVLEFTGDLFFLLEGAEIIQQQLERGQRSFSLDNGFGPSIASVQLRTSADGIAAPYADRYGPEGVMAQLAFVGWVAAVDGAWEKYRTNPPFEKSRKLRLGQEADLFGDLHKIRNDLLKNGAVAQARNVGKCACLKWFEPGDEMRLSLCHVFDFLHRLGNYLRSMTDGRNGSATWYFREQMPTCPQPYRVISYRVFVEPFPLDSKVPGFGLFVGLLFADGLAYTCEVARADSREALADRYKALREAPQDEYGGPIDPEVGYLDWRATYLSARSIIAQGGVPIDPGSPRILFRGPDDHGST